MLVAIVLMGTIVLSIMGGMWAVVRASRQNDDRAKVQAVLGAAGDGISNYRYIACPEVDEGYEQFGQKAAASVGWPLSTVEIVEYQYWNPETDAWADNNSIQGSECNENVGLTTSKTLQKLTIRATVPRWQLFRDHRHRQVRHSTQGDQRCLSRLIGRHRPEPTQGSPCPSCSSR